MYLPNLTYFYIASALAADSRNTIFISSMITQGERTPAFTGNAEYQVTGVNYEGGPGKITVTGEKSLNARGQQFRSDYGNGAFLDKEYNPDTVFVRTINDQQSIIGAYAYLLGIYPDTVNGITLEPEIEAINNVPVKNYDINAVRGNVRLSAPTKQTSQARLYPGNPDALFLTQIGKLYPGLQKTVDQQLYDAKVEYEETHGTQFYEDFANAIHRPVDNVNFYSIYRYADDILSTKANGEPSAVNLSRDVMNQLSVYYGHYFGNGIFRDEPLTRAFAHSYLSSVAHELQIKMEDDQSGKWSNQGIHEAKHSVYLANHLTLLASLTLFNEVEDYHVDFNDELRFQLFTKSGKYYVRSLLNDRPLSLEGTSNKNGEAEWSSWRDYICSKLYYGNLALVKEGRENPEEHVKLRDSCANFISNAFYSNDNVLLKDHERTASKPDEPTPIPQFSQKPRQEASPSILINNLDEGVRSQTIDINAGRTSQVVQYGFYRPIQLGQTQWQSFDLPMRKEFGFDNLSKNDIALNQYRRLKIEQTENTPINLAERHSFNFGHDLLKTREIPINNVDLIKIPVMSEKNIYLADRHQFNWGENPSLTTMTLKFNHQFKLKIPTTTTDDYVIPEKHSFNYNSNSLDVKKVNFDHIKSVRVKQAESYDVNLADFRFETLKQAQNKPATDSTAIDTPYGNHPVDKISQGSSQPAAKVSLGGNVNAGVDYVAPIRIKQEYNPDGVHSTADKTNAYRPTLKTAPEPASVVPEYRPPTTAPKAEPEQQFPSYTPQKQYPTYQPRTTTAPTSTAGQPRRYPSYSGRTGTNRVSSSPYTRH